MKNRLTTSVLKAKLKEHENFLNKKKKTLY